MPDSSVSTARIIAHPFFHFPILAAAMLLWAITDEHGRLFYSLLRWVCFAAFLTIALMAMGEELRYLCIIAIVGAAAFNPFFKFHFGRDVWIVVDGISAVLLLASAGLSTRILYRKGP